jgi:predicted porin
LKTPFVAFVAALPIAASVFLGFATPAKADLVLETETAQLGKKGHGNLSNALQFEKDKDGNIFLTETQLEYALTDRSEILIEPFFYELQKPSAGPKVHGVGDIEVTYSYLLVPETGSRPALIIAEKVKLPTATNRDIGTGKFDSTTYVIIGKTWGEVELNLNLGYEVVGKTSTADLKNQVIYDLSLDFPVAERTRLFAEAYGNTRPETGIKSTQAVSVGAEYQLTKHANVFAAVADDTDNLKIARIGLNYGW